MPASPRLGALVRRWPPFVLALASASGATYFAARFALARALTVAAPGGPDPWRGMAVRHLPALVACLAIFGASCVALRRTSSE